MVYICIECGELVENTDEQRLTWYIDGDEPDRLGMGRCAWCTRFWSYSQTDLSNYLRLLAPDIIIEEDDELPIDTTIEAVETPKWIDPTLKYWDNFMVFVWYSAQALLWFLFIKIIFFR